MDCKTSSSSSDRPRLRSSHKRDPAFAHNHSPRPRLYQEPTLLPISRKKLLIAPAPLRRCLSGDLKRDNVRNVPTKLPAARVPPNPTANERFATPLGQPGGHFHPCGAQPICGRQLGRDSGRGRKGGAPRKGCHVG